ncbi:unnamed protein product, partial [Cyprideis torosa]
MNPASRIYRLAIGLLMLLPLLVSAQSSAATFEENVHYSRLANPVPVSTPAGKVEVAEMFWYGCPHCFRLEPFIKTWKDSAPDDVEIVRIPGVLNPSWGVHARAYYAAEAMGVTDQLHEKIFVAIHEQGRRLNTEDAIVRFVTSQGVDGEAFKAAMNSMAASTKVARAEELGKLYELTGVPALIVGGKYRVLSSGVRSYDEMFNVVDFLAEKIRNN